MPTLMTDAFDWDFIKDKMKEGLVLVTFQKANQEIREMECTLAPYLLPETTRSSTRPPNNSSMVVYDIENEGWRSFRYDSVISVELVND